MLKNQRQDQILKLVLEKGSMTVEDLMKSMNVSAATVRRDLTYLDRSKLLLRTHGGAVRLEQNIADEVPITKRTHLQEIEKQQIASRCLQEIREGSIIYIGAGTTGRSLASMLGIFDHLTVVTNDIHVACEVCDTKNALIVAGGQLKPESSTLYGFFTTQMLQEFRIDDAFMSVDAIDTEKGFMDFGIDEVGIKRLVIKNSSRTVMMCDSSKFGRRAFIEVCGFEDVNCIVTDRKIDENQMRKVRDNGLNLILA